MSTGVLAKPDADIDASTGTATPRAESPRHMVQLDSVRAIAALLVLVGHFAQQVRELVPIHHMGVRLFFVLSGFLITGILLRCRDLAELENQGTWAVMKRFYARRFLRIFPLFYFTLIFALALDLGSARDNAAWLLTYSSNVFMAVTGQRMGALEPYWSLAVEEQFYLIWPWVIMVVPRRWLVRVIIATILIGPLYRGSVALLQMWQIAEGSRQTINIAAIVTMPFSCLDTLGMGALLAWTAQTSVDPKWRALLMRVSLWIGLPGVLAVQMMFTAVHDSTIYLRSSIHDLLMAFFFTWVVGRAATGFAGTPGAVLSWRPLVYIGTISYGVYLYHSYLFFIPHEKVNVWLAPYLSGLFGGGESAALTFLNRHFTAGVGLFIPRMVATFLLAALSWRLFEKPLNELKRYFEYDQRARGGIRARQQAAALPATNRVAVTSGDRTGSYV